MVSEAWKDGRHGHAGKEMNLVGCLGAWPRLPGMWAGRLGREGRHQGKLANLKHMQTPELCTRTHGAAPAKQTLTMLACRYPDRRQPGLRSAR